MCGRILGNWDSRDRGGVVRQLSDSGKKDEGIPIFQSVRIRSGKKNEERNRSLSSSVPYLGQRLI